MSTVSSRVWVATALGVLVGGSVGILIAGSAAAGDPTSLLTGPLRFFMMLFLAAVALTSLHETAHAVVARLAGWELFGVTIGHGRRRATVHVGSVRVELRGALVGGVTIARPTGQRWRDVSMLVAGATVEAVVIALAAAWTPASTWGEQTRWAIIVVAGIDIIVNLWPRRIDVGPIAGMMTDGAQLQSVLTTPGQWRHDIGQLQLTPRRARLVQAVHGGDADDAIELARRELSNDPGDVETAKLLGWLLLTGQHWRQAFDLLAPLASAPEAGHMLANNSAWAAVMTFDPNLLAHADHFSGRAIAERPTEPAYANTRGSTLVQLGRPDEGLPLLELAASGRLSHRQRAFVLAFTALAEHRLGRYDEASRHLTTSETLDRDCPALPHVRRAMAAPTEATTAPPGPAAWPPPRSADRVDAASRATSQRGVTA